jgi:hypothetical protein
MSWINHDDLSTVGNRVAGSQVQGMGLAGSSLLYRNSCVTLCMIEKVLQNNEE